MAVPDSRVAGEGADDIAVEGVAICHTTDTPLLPPEGGPDGQTGERQRKARRSRRHGRNLPSLTASTDLSYSRLKAKTPIYSRTSNVDKSNEVYVTTILTLVIQNEKE